MQRSKKNTDAIGIVERQSRTLGSRISRPGDFIDDDERRSLKKQNRRNHCLRAQVAFA
jgi:hypothetical protein